MINEDRRPTEDRDDVVRLLRLASKRPDVPHERRARVRAAARHSWREQVSRRRRRSLWLLIPAAAAVATIAIMIGLRSNTRGPTAIESSALVQITDGAVSAAAGPEPGMQVVGRGDRLARGFVVDTGESGRIALRLASGHSLRLNGSTRVRQQGTRTLMLEHGTIYLDSADGRGDGITVRTALGEIRELGTQFEVRADARSVRVRLREGAVDFERPAARHRIDAGHELTLDADGRVTRRELSADDPAWAWLLDLAPMPELEGRPAREFLDWVVREQGWRLAFADPELSRTVDGIVLGGTVGGLTPSEALDVVLPTCRLRHRVEGDVLVISTDEAP